LSNSISTAEKLEGDRLEPEGMGTWVSGPMLHRRRRYIVAFLSVASIALLIASINFPYWNVVLNAPQYPDGLKMQVHLTKVTGDVMEVDIINHYIGMKKMEEGAKFERSIALWGIALISIFSILFVFSGRKTVSLLAAPALIFPFVFLLDLFFWLYRYGHDLDPRAPISFKPFTPTLFGEGKIGQFSTVGSLDVGFYLVIGSFILILAALILRFLVCNACPYNTKCSLACPHLFLWPPQQYQDPEEP